MVDVLYRRGARLLRARISPQPLGRLRSKWRAVRLRSARGRSAGRCGRAARRLSIRLLLLCRLQPLRPQSVMINPAREAIADELRLSFTDELRRHSKLADLKGART